MYTVIEMPTLSPTMKKGTVIKWYKKEGDYVEKGETLFEIETDKANVEVDCLVSGFLRIIVVEAGIEVPINSPIAVIASTLDEEIPSEFERAVAKSTATHEKELVSTDTALSTSTISDVLERKKVRISPLAKRIAEEHSIDIESLKGSGPGGRIIREDVDKAILEGSKGVKLRPEARQISEIQRIPETYQEMELSKMRKVIAHRLSESKRTAPHFYIDLTVDTNGINQVKNNFDKKSEQLDGKITFNDIIIKLVSQALKEFPMVNASFAGDSIILHKGINIGVAVAVDEGLIVPVLKHVDQKTISQISKKMRELSEKARNKKLLPDEYSGGTFTITNLGMYGVETFHAIINPPESAILAIGAIEKEPIVIDGAVTVRPCMKLSLSVDHRVVDGVLAARFLGRVKELVEDPYLMLA